MSRVEKLTEYKTEVFLLSRQKTCPFISRKVGVWVLALMLCAVIQFGVVRDVKASMDSWGLHSQQKPVS